MNHSHFKFKLNISKCVLITIFMKLVIISRITVEGNTPSFNPLPYALSPTYLQFLSTQERKLYKAMKDYEVALEQRMKLVKKYTQDYEESSMAAESEVGVELKDRIVSSNPVLSFRMLSRYANEFIAIGENIAQNAEKQSSEIVYEAKGIYDFPSITDEGDAISAILRMQFMYEIPVHKIANGNIPGSQTSIGLTTNQCYQFAKTAQANKQYTLALDWFNVTKSNLSNDPQTRAEVSWNEKTIQDDMIQTISEHNKLFQELFDQGHEYIYGKRIRSLESPRPETLRNQIIKQYSGRLLDESHEDYYQAIYANHIALCNGGNFQKNSQKSRLKCYLDTSRNSYWKINPLRIEVVNINPKIVQIHDFISDEWMKYLKKEAHSKLDRAPSGPNATPRTAAYSWFKDEDIPKTDLSRRIEFVTGLNVRGLKASEALQIAAYAFGGHVELHFDSKGPNDPKPDPKGDRVTTFLIYLNDVKEGGLTSFPKLGFAVKPIKGSAILWYTNKKNGQVDPWTLHGACPLIYGHKWIATKWTHVNENIIKYPCGLSPKD